MEDPNQTDPTRRRLLKGLAAGSATAAGALMTGTAAAEGGRRWAGEADVLVVGSGAAGASAALAATAAGASVILFEKMPFKGGTTAKSGGVFWIPNNAWLKSQGIEDRREDALRYMVRLSYPHRYVAEAPRFGISPFEFDLIAGYYDHAAPAIDALCKLTSLKPIPWYTWEEKPFPDYFAQLPENTVHLGRSLVAEMSARPDMVVWPKAGAAGAGLIEILHDGLKGKPCQLLLEHQVLDLVRNADGAVIGLAVDRGDPAPACFRARKAVIFATGGFTQNPTMSDAFLKGPIWGGCAASGSTGDLVPIAQRAGALLGNMNNAWWAQVQVEIALKTRSVPVDVWSTPGDSMIQVNRFGRRFVNEKIQYDERAQTHFTWDPVHAEYPNRLGFMIWDSRTAKLYAGYDPIPAENAKLPQIIEGESLEALVRNIEARLADLREKIGGLQLDKNFLPTLRKTIQRYNGFAKRGKDEDFSRGEAPIEMAFQFMEAKPCANPYPNRTMHPIAGKGPYYAVILGAGTLDTKGGPVVNARCQVLDAAGKPIPGFYAAGNCMAHPAASAYWAGGGTIGPALTFGHVAGASAAAEPEKAA